MNRENNNLSKITWFIFLLLAASCFTFLGKFLIKHSIEKVDTSKVIYNEEGNIDYKVYLKENNYYPDKYLGKDMKYIASLINNISVDFNYSLHTSKLLNTNYTYKITADLVVTDKNDSTKVFQKPSVLVKETTEQITDEDLLIDKNININYAQYNNYVDAFKKDYGLTGNNVNSNLIVTMDIKVVGDYKDINLVRDNQLKITIPMSEQTFEISIDTKELDNHGYLKDNNTFNITDKKAFITGIVSILLAVISLVIALYSYFKKPKDKYKSTINKILKEYDRIIVNSNSINEIDFENIVNVGSIEELVDAYDTIKQPILYYEVIPNEKSYFLIIDNKTLYKLMIAR